MLVPLILNLLALYARNQNIWNWTIWSTENKKRKRKLTFKKANLTTWGESEINSDDKEEKDKDALLCLMAFNDEANKECDNNFSCFNDDNDGDMDDLYHKLYDFFVRAKKELKTKIV